MQSDFRLLSFLHVHSTNLGSGVLRAKREIRIRPGSPVVDLLAPKPGERILDLGCGDGVLTKKLADLGCEVVAVDSSLPQVEAARKLGLNAHAISGEELQYQYRENSMPCSVMPCCTGSGAQT